MIITIFIILVCLVVCAFLVAVVFGKNITEEPFEQPSIEEWENHWTKQN